MSMDVGKSNDIGPYAYRKMWKERRDQYCSLTIRYCEVKSTIAYLIYSIGLDWISLEGIFRHRHVDHSWSIAPSPQGSFRLHFHPSAALVWFAGGPYLLTCAPIARRSTSQQSQHRIRPLIHLRVIFSEWELSSSTWKNKPKSFTQRARYLNLWRFVEPEIWTQYARRDAPFIQRTNSSDRTTELLGTVARQSDSI